MIEDACVSQGQPGKSAGIFLGMTLRISRYARIRRGCALLQQLLRHWLQAGGSNKGLVHALDTGRKAVPSLGDSALAFTGGGFA
jgi:cell division inhibitor SulA